jgi:hypothetical protein
VLACIAGEGDEHDCADAILAALPGMVPDLQWEDFSGGGSRATAWGKARYLIMEWRDGRCEVVESYPGYQGDNLSGGFHPNIEAAKAAANAHHRAAVAKAARWV